MNEQEYIRSAMQMISLVRCALDGSKPSPELLEQIDSEKLFQVCEAHILTACAAYALESAGVTDKKFTEAKNKAIRKNIIMDTERKKVLERLESEGIWHMPLKGAVLHDWYPKLGMRQMSDNDILFDPAARASVRQIMLDLGFTCEHYGYSHNDDYFKPPVCNFEMHHVLFTQSQEENLSVYYTGIRERLRKADNRSYEYSFSPEDFYIYLIAHEYRHFCGGGTGVRSLADTYVILRKYENQFDWDYIRAELEKLSLSEFESKNRTLALKLFAGDSLSADDSKQLRYYILSGTYGTQEHKVGNKLRESGQSKFRYAAKRMFPDRGFIRDNYPFFYRHKLLIPLLWVYRPVHGLVTDRKRLLSEFRILLRKKRTDK